MFHRTSCEAAQGAGRPLLEHTYRKLVYLVSVPNRDLYTQVLDAKDCAAQTDLEILEGQVLDLEFQIGMCVVSVTRFLTDHRAGLPLSATVRLLDTQDFLMTLCPMIEKAPWVRKSIRGEVQKYEKQEWVLVEEEEMGKPPE